MHTGRMAEGMFVFFSHYRCELIDYNSFNFVLKAQHTVNTVKVLEVIG